MKKLLPIAAVLACLPSLQAAAQDMAVAQKWASAKVVRYRVEGVHKARIPVVLGDYEGKGDVTDRVTVEFTWDVKKSKVIGAVKVTDGTTEVANLKSDGTNCGPPQLKGPYEHFQTRSSSMVGGDLIQITGTRTYPATSVSNYPASCSMRSIPGGTQEAVLHLGGMGPEALAMPNVPGAKLSISADRKSFTIVGAENWVWTYGPTLVE